MNKKVSLKEIVGNKIVYAVVLTAFYWMWARSDWKDWYETVQFILSIFLITFFVFQVSRIKKYKKENVDEMAEQNLRRCDSFCLKLFVGVMIVTAWACGVLGHVNAINLGVIGWIIVLSILVLSVVRTVMFIILDSKGV